VKRYFTRTIAIVLQSVLGCSAFLSSCLAQSTLRVPADRTTIQTAINDVSSGGAVIVAPGTYLENLNFNGKALSLESEQGAAVTIIDGRNAGSVFTFDNGETHLSRVSGFTIRNGETGLGGAINALGASPTIVDNIITGNASGAIWGNGSSMVLQRNLFTGHSTCNSWGVVAFVNESSPTIKNNVFAGNRCVALNITVPEGSIPEVSNNTFVDNDVGLFVGPQVRTDSHIYRNNLFYLNGIGVEVGYAYGFAAHFPTLLNTLNFGNTANYVGFTDPTGANGNISVDPLLGGVSANDFRPDSSSPAINAGTNMAVGGGDTDFHRGTRILGAAVDIGAGEYVGPPPVVTLSSDKLSIVMGESITLTWTSSGAVDCFADGAWSGARTLSGSQTVTPTQSGDLTYKVICRNASAARAGVVAVYMIPLPVITISLLHTTAPQSSFTQLNWSVTSASTCTASGAWTGNQSTSGLLAISAGPPGTYTYTLSCTGPSGSTTASAVLIVPERPTISFVIDKPAIILGATSTLLWNATNATSCLALNGWSGPRMIAGTQVVGPLPVGRYDYVIECHGPGGYSQATTTLTVRPPSFQNSSGSGGGGTDGRILFALLLLIVARLRNVRFQV